MSLEGDAVEEEEDDVRPVAAPAQDAVSPATIGVVASLMQAVKEPIKELSRSLVWTNLMWVVVFAAFVIVIETVPAAEEFLKHVILIFRNRTVAHQCTQ